MATARKSTRRRPRDEEEEAPSRRTRASSSSSSLQVDFSDTEGRGSRHFKPGDYAVRVVEAKRTKSANKGTQQVSFKYEFADGKYKGQTIYQNCNLLPQSLWVLRNALEAMGFKVSAKAMNIDLAKCKNKKLAISIEDDEYDNKTRSRVVDTFSLEELEEPEADLDEDLDEDEDEEEEDEDEEDEEDEELDEVDLDDV